MNSFTIDNKNVPNGTFLSYTFIDEYLKNANEAQIKIYLFLLRKMSACQATSVSAIADEFNYMESDVLRVINYWENLGLLHTTKDTNGNLTGLSVSMPSAGSTTSAANSQAEIPNQALETASVSTQSPSESGSVVPLVIPQGPENPGYSLDEIASFQNNDEFQHIIFIAQSYLGRPLSTTDLGSLAFIYDRLQFSFDLMDYLVQYCVSKGKREMRYIERVALAWYDQKVTTVEDAKQHSSQYDKIVYTVMKALGRTSAPTKVEAGYVKKWTGELGFSDEMILEACNRCVQRTDSNRFEYTNSILNRWHSANVHSLADLAKEDEQYKLKQQNKVQTNNAGSKGTFNQFTHRDYDYDALEEALRYKG